MKFDEDGNRGLSTRSEFGYDNLGDSLDRHRLFYGTGDGIAQEVVQGLRNLPVEEELIAELPVFES